jgi:hypothetical protein
MVPIPQGGPDCRQSGWSAIMVTNPWDRRTHVGWPPDATSRRREGERPMQTVRPFDHPWFAVEQVDAGT